VCNDNLESILERVDELCFGEKSAVVGSLFTYSPITAVPRGSTTITADAIANDREIAWDAADVTVQEWEYLMRGLSAKIPGTLSWKNEQLKTKSEFWAAGVSTEANPSIDKEKLNKALNTIVPKLIAMMERIQKEGLAYMRVRADRLQELYPLIGDEDREQDQENLLWGTVTPKEDGLLEDGNKNNDDEEPQDIENFEALGELGDVTGGLKLEDLTRQPNFGTKTDNDNSSSGQSSSDSGSSSSDSSDEEEEEYNSNRSLTDQEMQFLGFMSQGKTNAKDLQDAVYGDLTKEQRQQLKFLEFSSPTMSREEEEELKERMLNNEDFDADLSPEERNYKQFLEHFAAPGPTTDMFNILLDTTAVLASHIKDPYTFMYHNDLHPRSVDTWFQEIMERHELDGGDEKNTNECTVPNVVSFNATLRLCADLHYEQPPGDDSNSSEGSSMFSSLAFLDPKYTIYKMQRDEALTTAMYTFDRLTHCGVAAWSPASFAYMLRLLSKYIPVSPMRGNVTIAMFFQASEAGLVDGFVLRELLAANQPCNSAEHDKWIAAQGVKAESSDDNNNDDAATGGNNDSDGKPKENRRGRVQGDLAKEYGQFSTNWTKHVKEQRYLNYDSTY